MNAAQDVLLKCKGIIPDSLAELLLIRGVGNYIAQAILCFSFHFENSIVDVNVARFIYRIYGIRKRLPNNPSRDKNIASIKDGLLPYGDCKEFILSILDLCAFHCKAKKTICINCPVLNYCITGNTN